MTNTAALLAPLGLLGLVATAALMAGPDDRKGEKATPKQAKTLTAISVSADEAAAKPKAPTAQTWTRNPITGEWSRHNVNVTGIQSAGGSYHPIPDRTPAGMRSSLDRPAYKNH